METHNNGEKHLENLTPEEIEGQRIMGGGSGIGLTDNFDVSSNIDPHVIAPGPDEMGYDTTVIPLDTPAYPNGGNTMTEIPPIENNNFTANPGYEQGNI